MKIDLFAPASWHEIPKKKLKGVFKILQAHEGEAAAYVKTLVFFFINDISVSAYQPDRSFLINFKYHGKYYFMDITSLRVLELMGDSLDWLEKPFSGLTPFRPKRLAGGRPKLSDFSDVSFGDWIQIENLYQGFMITHDESLLLEILKLVVSRRYRKPQPWELYALMVWIASVKEYFALRYPDFFSDSSGSTPSADQIMKNNNAMIRALTQGDPLKEQSILELDCRRALVELDAQAREYKEMKSKMDNAESKKIL